MKRLIDYIKRNYKYIFRAFLFVITTSLIVYIFPREGKFRYEFQKGRPWLHENLFAPFDFPIYKSEKQLQDERDSTLKHFDPYFKYDSTVLVNETNKFLKYYAAKQEEFIIKETDKNSGFSTYKKQNFINNSDNFKQKAIQVLEEIYIKGIIELNEVTEKIANDESIIILQGKIAQNYVLSAMYTQKSAYENVTSAVEIFVEKNKSRLKYPEFYKNINLYEYIVPNVLYDKTTSEAVKNELLKNVSLTKGMVQAGEKIISQGEIIDTRLHRILESLKYESETRLGDGYFSEIILLGQIIFVVACIGVLFLFLLNFRSEILKHSLKTTFILMLVLIVVFISRFTVNYLYIIPVALVPIIIKTFYDARLALFIHIVTVLLVGFLAPNGFEFVFLSFIAGIVAIFSLTNLYRRGKLFLSAGLVFVSYSFVYFGLAITQEGSFSGIDFQNFKFFALNGGLVLLAYPLIYIFEKTFGFLSDLTLMELSDTNQKLLRTLAEKAPGTFQHSMQVANLAEEAIHKIGGNPLLVRTGALYHDIGKMNNPAYFIENQRMGFNPHDMHEFDESANIIISHVRDGVELAKKNKLPEPLIDFIRTHHGTSKVQYFYRSYIKKFPDKDVDINKFTYPGPKPYSKEMAVLMMADSVEAASRSLSEINEEKISNLVEMIISDQINDGQFDYVDINFKNITEVKAIFKDKLMNIYHARIKYPEKKQE
ncbi:MAG TPA: transmembrane HD family protein [Bacteroidales bacterium]|nr:transmembrane HD family protein [Bacteroidales bacterium]